MRNLILTILLYSFPIIIYRFVIARKTIDKFTSKIITIVYAIVAFFVMAAILGINGGKAPGGAIVFWSFVNYYVLTSGKAENNADSSIQNEKAEAVITNSKVIESRLPTVDDVTEEVEDLPDTESESSDSEAQKQKQQMRAKFCYKCGASLVDGAMYCIKCGAKIWLGDNE